MYRLTLTFIKVDAVEPNIDADVNVIANVYATVTIHDDVKHEQNCFVAVVNAFVTGSGKYSYLIHTSNWKDQLNTKIIK